MTSETSRRSRNFCLQKQPNLASRCVGLDQFRSQMSIHLEVLTEQVAGGIVAPGIWSPRCVPGSGRSRDRRHARYAVGHHPCSLAGSEEAREKGQRRRLAQVAIACAANLTVCLYNTTAKCISGVLGLVWILIHLYRGLLQSKCMT